MSVQAIGARTGSWRRLLAGGPQGNTLLTATSGALLLVLLAVEGVTIVFLRPLLWIHLFVGILLIPPILVKLASTGYRFVHYYAGSPPYRRKGPPEPVLRLAAPLLVASTLAVFVSGVVLLLVGPSSRSSVLPIHKVTFFVWLALFGVHLLGHLPSLPRAVRIDYGGRGGRRSAGTPTRRTVLAAALLAGVLLALVVLPDFPAWLHYNQLRGHH